MARPPKFKILAIDGGGIRGVVPLQVIRYIESVTKKEIHQSFDLIAGTSTGGILSSALTIQDKNSVEADTRKYTLDKLESIYKDRGKEIFPAPSKFVKWYTFCKSWIQPQFDPKGLNEVLKEYFGEERISNCLKPIFIASYDIHRNKPVFFTYREASLFADRNPTLVEIARATSAAPTYFPTYDFHYASERLICIDGGIYMNNPSLGVLVEVLGNADYKHYKLNNKVLQMKDIALLSLGTGHTNSLVDGIRANGWGKFRWIKPVIDLSTNGPVKVIDNQIETIFKSFSLDSNYLRVDIYIKNRYSEMSDVRDSTIDYLIKEAQSQILNNDTMRSKIDIFLREAGLID
ncbi:patatin-like phospholipase family protein [Dyadobacter subterraneus]|uniref:Patatin-like phospholipase family protein n=1 Tax=Dyadobacter subterraneus TaxID=2773304 RepID=A0ABR9WGS1_9BACT|nr:patatin-like phospholipase family protein [Dyadobacter subterraneus]MBE9464705.1 patatin-like phospholipase family protein [Dyadobacter subterraneus]